MNTARKGNAFERVVRAYGVEHGALVASRRHIEGPGDELWVWPDGEKWLIEVKATKNPWSTFGPAERVALSVEAKIYGCTPLLAFRLEKNRIEWYTEDRWPSIPAGVDPEVLMREE